MDYRIIRQFHEDLATGDATDAQGVVSEAPTMSEPEANEQESEAETTETSTTGGGQDENVTVDRNRGM